MDKVLDNKEASEESTILSVLAQAYARGAKREELQWLIDQLILDSSHSMVDDLFAGRKCKLREYSDATKTW